MKKYTTERGIEISIIPIPLLLDRVKQRHYERMEEELPAPTYAETTASGKEHRVKMVEADMAAAKEHNPDWYAEHAEAWEAYQAESAAWAAKLNDLLMDTIALKAVRVDMPPDDTWAEEQSYLGLDVPDGPLERRIHYVKTEVIGGQNDVIRIMLMASGTEVTEEVLAAATASFRGVLQGQVVAGLGDQGGAVESESATNAAPGGGAVRDGALNVLGVRPG